MFAEGAHPLVGEAVPQGNACCSRGETGAGEIGQIQCVGGQQVVDDHPGAEPEARGIHGEQPFAQGGADVVVAGQVRDPGPQACAERSRGGCLDGGEFGYRQDVEVAAPGLRGGLPPAARIRQLNADFDLARPSIVIALADDGSITGFSYSLDLNSSTWQAAARTRGTYFDTLPAAELAAIKATPAGTFGAGLWTGVTHLPGHHHVGAALSEGLFAVNASRLGLGEGVIVYNLLTTDTLDLPYLTSAGFTQRTTSIPLEDCLADEWVCTFGEQGIAGWATGAPKRDRPAYPSPDPRSRRQRPVPSQPANRSHAGGTRRNRPSPGSPADARSPPDRSPSHQPCGSGEAAMVIGVWLPWAGSYPRSGC